MSTERHIKLASMLRLVVRDELKVMDKIDSFGSWAMGLGNRISTIHDYAEGLSTVDRDLKGIQTRMNVLIDMLTEFKVLGSEPTLNDEKRIAESLAKIADSMANMREYLKALKFNAPWEMSRLNEEVRELTEFVRGIDEKYKVVMRRTDKIMDALGVKEEVTKS